MMPTIRIICQNYDCEAYNQEVVVSPDEVGLKVGWCPKCSHSAQVRVNHMSVEADSTEAFYKQIVQMVREFRLLSRILSVGISSDSDNTRFNELDSILKGLQCTYCGAEVLTDVETHAEDKRIS